MKYCSGDIRNGRGYACVGTRIQWKGALLHPQICCEILAALKKKKKSKLLKKEKILWNFLGGPNNQNGVLNKATVFIKHIYRERKLKEKGFW